MKFIVILFLMIAPFSAMAEDDTSKVSINIVNSWVACDADGVCYDENGDPYYE